MKFNIKTLDNKEKIWKPSSNIRTSSSNLHFKAKEIIKEFNPTLLIMEEVFFPLYSNRNLAFDFFIPSLRLIVEVQGEQHFKFVPYFHASKQDFRKQVLRDLEKQQWCELNGFDVKYLCHFESNEEWRSKIG